MKVLEGKLTLMMLYLIELDYFSWFLRATGVKEEYWQQCMLGKYLLGKILCNFWLLDNMPSGYQ